MPAFHTDCQQIGYIAVAIRLDAVHTAETPGERFRNAAWGHTVSRIAGRRVLVNRDAA